jgi:hypothetical protein
LGTTWLLLFKKPACPPVHEFEAVTSTDDAFALCNTFVFDIRDNPAVALHAFPLFEAAATNVKMILISTLMTLALTPTSPALAGNHFRKRRPDPLFKTECETELKATKLSRENPFINVYVLSCGNRMTPVNVIDNSR